MNFYGITNKKKAVRAYRNTCANLHLKWNPDVENHSAHEIVDILKTVLSVSKIPKDAEGTITTEGDKNVRKDDQEGIIKED